MNLDTPPLQGRAASGTYQSSSVLTCRELPSLPRYFAPTDLELEDYQTLIRPGEQKFYDWCVGILEDSGVVGNLKNERLYLTSEFRSELETAGTTYVVEMSRTSVYFAHKDVEELCLLFADAGVSTDGELLEARHVRQSFKKIRQQTVLNRLWAVSTNAVRVPAAGIGNLRLNEGGSLAALEIETGLGECTVSLHRGADAETFRYWVTDAGRSVRFTPRVADALMSDFAEDLGVSPEPATVLDAMMGTFALAQTDQEWLSL